MTEWMLIAGMVFLTFGPRYLPFSLAGKVVLPPLILRALNYVPIAVLSAIAAQTTLVRDQKIDMTLDNPYLIAAVAACMVAYYTRHLFLTIALGMVTFALVKWLWL